MTDTSKMEPAGMRAELMPLLRLAIPLMVGLAATLLIGVVDTAMVAPLGTVPLAATGVTSAVMVILVAALWGVVTAISVQISQAEGAQDAARVALALRSGVWLCLICGGGAALMMLALFPLLAPMGQPLEVLAILLPYWLSMAVWIVPFTLFFGLKALFDAVGWPWTAVALSYVGVGVNVPANYLFIHVFGWGILGAGLASILSQCAALLAIALVLARAPGLAPYRQQVAVRMADVRAQFKEAMPLCLGYAGEGGAYALVGLMLGWLGAQALAAQQIVSALAGLAYMIPLGMAGAASIRVGQAVGSGARQRLRPILRACFAMVLLWQAFAAVAFVTLGRPLAESLSEDREVIDLAVTLFVIFAMLQFADGIQGTALGALRGMSDMLWPTFVTLAAYWPLALPLCYLLGFSLELGAVGIWLGYTGGLVVAAIALPWRFWWLTR